MGRKDNEEGSVDFIKTVPAKKGQDKPGSYGSLGKMSGGKGKGKDTSGSNENPRINGKGPNTK